jgi:hypothetical protein
LLLLSPAGILAVADINSIARIFVIFGFPVLLSSPTVQAFILLKASLLYFCYFCWQSILAAGIHTIAGVPAVVGVSDVAGIPTFAIMLSVADIAACVPTIDGALLCC